jgi:hypothetical protein
MVGGFIKNETYTDWKYPRGIHPRGRHADKTFLSLVGPALSMVEERLYNTKWFIKHVPVADRPRWIEERLGNRCTYPYNLIGTDYSSFEASFVPDFMLDCELQLYAYMLRNANCHAELMALLKYIPGVNTIAYKNLTARVNGVRMSGDYCTSLGNGFSNLMVMLYMAECKKWDVDGFVEGDDGLFSVKGGIPTIDDYKQMGFNIKIETGNVLGDMGFCHLYYDKDVLDNVVDPAETLCKFGWSHSLCRSGGLKTRQALLRAKADSLAACVPGAPIVSALARYAQRVTPPGERKYIDGKQPNKWYRETANTTAKTKPVAWQSRVLCQKLFGVSVGDQIEIEKYIDSLSVMGELRHPLISGLMKPVWRDYWNRYVVDLPDPTMISPCFP